MSDDSDHDHLRVYDSSYEGTMGDDSDCATDYECASLGECGLGMCKYGPSVDAEGVNLPSDMYECTMYEYTKTDCMWVVCRECHQKGGHKRHNRYLKLTN